MRVLVSGGGTGGHIYPALSLIREIQESNPKAEFLYVGTEKGLENDIVKKENIPFRSIYITGFKRKLSFENVKTIARFLKGVQDSKKIMKEFKPDVVLGTGGYVCGPVVYAAAKLGIPTVIHEQNSVPGITNKFLSKYVDKVAICFEAAASYFPEEKTALVGNPRGSEVLGYDSTRGKELAGLHPNKKSVLIFGGSRGATPINNAVLGMLKEVGNRDYEILYVTGNAHYDNVMKEAEKIGIPENVFIKPFVYNMPEILSGMDIIVGRAGATSLAEITALGKASILIPSPYVTNNHQEKNAQALKDNGAAIICLEKDLTGANLLQDIDHILLNDETLRGMEQASKELGIPDAATRLYQLMKSIIGK